MAVASEISPTSATAFSVLFFDGDREIDAGEVLVDSGITFQKLQFLVGDMIGVSSHQIKLYLLRQRKARSGRPPTAEIWTKAPIGEGTNFAAVAREKGCAILAQLKGTVKDRHGRGRRDRVGGGGGGGGGKTHLSSAKKRAHQPEKAALRRPVGFPLGASASSIAPVAEESGAGIVGLFQFELLRELQRQKERYLLATPAAGYYYHSPLGHESAGAVCEVCSGAVGERAAAFHWCVRDKVVAGAFRSSAGPIQRPLKSRVQASA